MLHKNAELIKADTSPSITENIQLIHLSVYILFS